jgi:nitrate/nitrite-specific signal transduction histidine kinase
VPLQSGADRIGSGDWDSQIDVRTGDELEDLAGRFNTMTAQLRESYADLEHKVEARTAELSDALEQQTATADVLKVIGGSPTNVEPVFNAIVQRAVQLGEASAATAFLYDGEQLRYMTSFGWSTEWVEHLREESPFAPDMSRLSGQVVLRRSVVTMGLPESRDEGHPWECARDSVCRFFAMASRSGCSTSGGPSPPRFRRSMFASCRPSPTRP